MLKFPFFVFEWLKTTKIQENIFAKDFIYERKDISLSLSLVKTSIFLAFVVSLSLVQANPLDNTLDFSSSTDTPSNTLPKQDSQQSATNTTNTQANQVPIKLRNRNKGKFTFELGIGYVASWFNARQKFAESLNVDGTKTQELTKDKSVAHGADLYFNGNYYIKDRFGWTFGLGMEFIDISWGEGLAQVNAYYDVEMEQIKQEFLYAMYYHTGFFGDVWKKNNQSLRLFGTIGVSIDFLFGGLYEKAKPDCSGYFCTTTYTSIYDTKDKTISATLPITLGLRYNFAKRHGIEVFGKYHALSWNFTQAHINPNLTTNISRGASVGVRYVFEYK